jgi:hypothetical protein
MDMKTIFWNLFKYLSDQNLHPHTRDVSIRLETAGTLVDLIPACRERETPGSALFNKRAGQAVHTDVSRHVHLIANSGCQQEICTLKIWRERMSLDFPSLYLELTVLRALGSERFGQLADNILAVFRHLSSKFEQSVIADPSTRTIFFPTTSRYRIRRPSPKPRATPSTMRTGRKFSGRKWEAEV